MMGVFDIYKKPVWYTGRHTKAHGEDRQYTAMSCSNIGNPINDKGIMIIYQICTIKPLP